jgi:EmrB/QacA subfamily drug resistance transporter
VPTDHDRPRVKRFRGSVLVSAALGAALTPLNSTMVAVALPDLAAQFSSPAAAVTVFVVTGYLIATLVLSVPAGSVADRVGYTRALMWGRWMFAAGSILGTLAPTLGLVVVGRLLMAGGGALINPTAMALLRISVPPERRSRAFGTMGAVMGGAAAIGPALGGWISAEVGWRMLFVINLPLLVISWLFEPRVEAPAAAQREASRWFDWPGSVLLGVALVAVTIATRTAAPLAYWLAIGGAIAFVALILHERRIDAPVLNLSFFRRRGFVAGAGVIATQNLAMYSLLIQIPFLFGGGDQASRLGLAIIAMTLTMAVMSPLGGWLVEWIGVRAVVVTGGLLAAAGVIGLTQLATTARPYEIAMRLLLVGLGLGLSTGPANASAVTAVPAHQSAMASATVSMLRYVGAIGGTVILSFAMSGGQAESRPAVALWAFVAALLLSALLGLALPPLPDERPRSR